MCCGEDTARTAAESHWLSIYYEGQDLQVPRSVWSDSLPLPADYGRQLVSSWMVSCIHSTSTQANWKDKNTEMGWLCCATWPSSDESQARHQNQNGQPPRGMAYQQQPPPSCRLSDGWTDSRQARKGSCSSRPSLSPVERSGGVFRCLQTCNACTTPASHFRKNLWQFLIAYRSSCDRPYLPLHPS